MAPGDVCHGPRCSLAGLGPAALEYRSCHWPGGSAGSPQCVRPMGCWFFPVPRPPYVCAASWASRLLFTGVPARCVVLRVRRPGPPGSCSPVCPLGVVCCVCGVLGPPAPVHRCARSVCCVACAASWASRLLFTGAPARCVVWRVRRPGPPGSCSPLCPLGVLCCVCGVLGLPAPVHRCARSVCCVACAASWASRLLFTGVPARCVVLRVRRPGPPGSCSPVRPLGVLCCVCRVLGLPAPVHRCARSVCCVACAASWASRLLFTAVPARCVVLRVRRPGPPGSCPPLCPLGVLCCVCGVLGLPAPVHRCARSVCCVACAASWASRLLFTGAPARCVVLRVRRPGPPGSCSPVCPLGVLCCVCGVLGLPAPVHRCARSVCCAACAASWASRLLSTGAPARRVVLRVRRPGPPGSCSPVCPLGVLCCVCGVLGLPAPVHRCACSVCCVACAASWASRLLFTGAPARCVVLRVRRPGPPGSCSPVRPLGVVCCVACAASWASRLLFTGVPARCVVLRVRRPGPPGSCPPVCPLAVLCCVCGVLGLPAPVHRCARSVCCVACAVSWASRLLFTGVPARCVVLRVRRPGPPGSCSPVCLLGVLCCVCGVLGLPAPVHRCARSVCCVACAASWASRLLFTGAPARCGVLCCVCGVLGLPAPVHRCARSVCCVACAASWASRLLFTGVPARCVVLCVRCPGPPGSCSPVRPLGVLCCVCGVLGLPAPVHRCARSVWCVVLRVRRPGPPGSCSPVCPLGVLCCVCGVLGLPAPVHRRARSVCCVTCAASWASRLLFTGVPARCVVLLCGVPLRGAHSSIRTAAIVAGKGWVPSGRTHVHPDGGCSLPAGVGYPPGAHSSIRTAAGVRVLALCGRVGRAGLPGALWCAAPFPLAALSFCFAWPPPGWGCPPLSCCPCRSSLPWRRALVVFLGLPLPASSCARASFVSPAWPLAALWWFLPPPPPFLCLGVFVAPAWCLGFVFFFFFSLPLLCAPVVFGFLWFPAPGALGLGAVRCLLCWPSASRLSVRLSLFHAFRLAGACSPSVAAPPPPPFLSRGFRRCRSVLCAVCCVVLCVLRCGAVPRCARWVLLLVAPCPLALPVALGPCAPRRCVLPCSPVLCVCCRGAGVRAVVGRSALCCVCPGVLCCAFSVLSALCGAVLRCAGALALCFSCGARCCWRLVLWCAMVRCWVWWPVVVCWWRVSVSLSGRVVCFPVVGVVCCGALLSCVVFCGAVLSRGAVLLCSAVVLRCCWGLLCPPVGCRAVLCCAVGWLCCFLPGGGGCVLWCSFPRAVRSLSSPLCALRCLVVLAVVPCFPVSCAVALCRRVVLCCRALLSFCGAVCVCCDPSCGASVVCAVVGASCCGVSLCVVVSPWAFCGVVVLLWCVVVSCCAVRCPVVSCVLCRVLRCRAAMRCCAGLFVAWVWLYLLEKPPQNFVKYFFFFFAFEKKKKNKK